MVFVENNMGGIFFFTIGWGLGMEIYLFLLEVGFLIVRLFLWCDFFIIIIELGNLGSY